MYMRYQDIFCLYFYFLSCSFSIHMLPLCLLSASVYFLVSVLSSSYQLSLLKEAEIHAEQREFELNRRRQMGLSASHHSLDNIEFDNKEDDQHDQRLLSQFGIWFLVCNHKLLLCLSITGRRVIRMCSVSYRHSVEFMVTRLIALLLPPPLMMTGEPVHP